MSVITPNERYVRERYQNRDGRPCDNRQILLQIGVPTVMGITGSMHRVFGVTNTDGETCGVILWMGSSRAVEVILDWDDTYTVSRNRIVTKGKNAGTVVTENLHREFIVISSARSSGMHRAGNNPRERHLHECHNFYRHRHHDRFNLKLH